MVGNLHLFHREQKGIAMGRTRKQFNQEFKEEAVKLLLSSDKTTEEIAADLGIGLSTLQKWKRLFHPGVSKAKAKRELSEAEQELIRIKRENSNLKKQVEILKKATAFFAKEQL